MTVEAARRANIEVSVCGEVASDPFYVPLLISLGIKNISLAPSSIPEIKKILRSISVNEWEEFWEKEISKIDDIEKIKELTKNKILKDCPDIFDWERFQ